MIFAVSTNKKKKKNRSSRITIKWHQPHRSRRSSHVLIFVPDVAGHECPTINYFKVTFFVTFRIRISLVQKPDQWSGTCMSCICVVGLSFNPFLALAIHCSRRRETISVSNYEVLWTIIFGIQLMQKSFSFLKRKQIAWHSLVTLVVKFPLYLELNCFL